MSKEEPCSACNDLHWLHIGEPFEIQWCDCTSAGNDAIAVELHRKECGCDWPDVDYQNLAFRWIELRNQEMVPKELRDVIHRYQTTAGQRELFALNITHLTSLVGQALQLYYKHWDQLGGRQGYLFNQLQGVACCLVSAISLIECGLWKPHWTWDPDDGTIIDGKWRAQSKTPAPKKHLDEDDRTWTLQPILEVYPDADIPKKKEIS